MILENNKLVQKAGCSALATLEEEAGMQILPFLDPIVNTLIMALQKYQQKNLLILYDAFGTLADTVRGALSVPKYVDMFMPLLMAKWQQVPDDSRNIFPIFEVYFNLIKCLSCIAIAIKDLFAPFALPVWNRCLRLITECLMAAKAHENNPQLEFPDKEFLIVSLDLISGIIQSLGVKSSALIEDNPSFYNILAMCAQDPTSDVKTSAFACIGDLAMMNFPSLASQLPALMPIIVITYLPRLRVLTPIILLRGLLQLTMPHGVLVKLPFGMVTLWTRG